jgi:hypothetical protein
LISFLIDFLMSIQSFNIKFIRDWTSDFFFNLLFIRLFQFHDLNNKFEELTKVIGAFFFLFLVSFFFQFYHLILGWLRIKFHDLFKFAFYKLILISWLVSQVWQVNPSWLKLFLYIYIFNFISFQFYFFDIGLIKNWVS